MNARILSPSRWKEGKTAEGSIVAMGVGDVEDDFTGWIPSVYNSFRT